MIGMIAPNAVIEKENKIRKITSALIRPADSSMGEVVGLANPDAGASIGRSISFNGRMGRNDMTGSPNDHGMVPILTNNLVVPSRKSSIGQLELLAHCNPTMQLSALGVDFRPIKNDNRMSFGRILNMLGDYPTECDPVNRLFAASIIEGDGDFDPSRTSPAMFLKSGKCRHDIIDESNGLTAMDEHGEAALMSIQATDPAYRGKKNQIHYGVENEEPGEDKSHALFTRRYSRYSMAHMRSYTYTVVRQVAPVHHYSNEYDPPHYRCKSSFRPIIRSSWLRPLIDNRAMVRRTPLGMEIAGGTLEKEIGREPLFVDEKTIIWSKRESSFSCPIELCGTSMANYKLLSSEQNWHLYIHSVVIERGNWRP